MTYDQDNIQARAIYNCETIQWMDEEQSSASGYLTQIQLISYQAKTIRDGAIITKPSIRKVRGDSM